MRKGQTVHGYLVESRPSNANAGKCMWAFASRDGQEYFIKEFLEPRRPRADSMGTPEDKRRRWAECDRFERRHRQLIELLSADHLYAGNLVLPKDFFLDGTRYYKVTDRIRPAEVVTGELAPRLLLVLLGTLADSLRLLHGAGIVHGDLKPENVLLRQRTGSVFVTAKLIDFDDAYPAGEPPPKDLVGGNPLYGAPEWLRYLSGDPAVPAAALTQAADMFAFGLLVHTYVFGSLPGHDGHDSPAAAVRDGSRLRWDERAGPGLTGLLTALTEPDPVNRPDIAAAAGELADPTVIGSPARRAGQSRLRINLTGRPMAGRMKGTP